MLHMIVALQICVLELCGSIVFNNFQYIIQFCVTLATPDLSSERQKISFPKWNTFVRSWGYLYEGIRSSYPNFCQTSPGKSQVRGWNIEIPKKYIYKTNKQTKTKSKAKQSKVITSCITKWFKTNNILSYGNDKIEFNFLSRPGNAS